MNYTGLNWHLLSKLKKNGKESVSVNCPLKTFWNKKFKKKKKKVLIIFVIGLSVAYDIFLPGYSTNFVTLITILFLWISTKNWLTALSNSFSYIFLSLCTHDWHHTTALLSKKTTVDEQIFLKEKNPSCNKTNEFFL